MRSDEGLRFHAIVQTADGAMQTRETDNRLELLAWIERHVTGADTASRCRAVVIEVGTTAKGPAVRHMLAAIALGAANAAKREQQQ